MRSRVLIRSIAIYTLQLPEYIMRVVLQTLSPNSMVMMLTVIPLLWLLLNSADPLFLMMFFIPDLKSALPTQLVVC